MTVRAWLNYRVRWQMGVSCAGVVLFISGILLEQAFGQQIVTLVAIPGFALAFLMTVYAYYFGLRCPKCWGNMAPLVFQKGGFSVDQRVRFCPYCGYALDDDLGVE